MNQFPPDPWVSHCGHFKVLRKFTETFATLFIFGVFTCSNNTGDKLSLALLLPAINYLWFFWHRRLCLVPNFHQFHDTSDNLWQVTNDTGDNYLPVTTTPVIFYPRCQQHQLWNSCNNISLPTSKSNSISTIYEKNFLSQNFSHLLPLSLTPVINLFLIYSQIFVKILMVQ